MKKRDDKLSWLIGISILFITILIYYNLENLNSLLINAFFALISAIICYKLSIKIKSNGVIAYLLGLILGVFGLLIYWIFYYIRKRNLVLEKTKINNKK